MFSFLSKNSSSFFGIDLGTTGIRIVELAWEGGRVVLRNYVSLEAGKRINPDGTVVKKDIQSLDKDTIESMKTILNTADVAHHKVAMSVPASSTFTSIVSFPRMSQDQLETAVNYEAPKYIPIPMEEVVFGWNIISNDRKVKSVKGKEKEKELEMKVGGGNQYGGEEKTRVLLIAIPKEISAKYLEIANAFSLDLVSLETESFSLARSLVGHREGAYIIIDVGYKMTGITIVDDGSVTESHSISTVGGEELTKVIGNSFGINEERANILKKEAGLNSPSEKKLADILMPILSIIISEAKKNEQAYLHTNGKKISGIILTGGSARMPGFQEYVTEEMNLPVEMGNPFREIAYDTILEDKLGAIASSYAVAVGLALYNFEKKM